MIDSRGEYIMQIAPELGIPEVKPAIESIRGRWIQKVSPQSRHSVVQLR
ncbi:MAG: Uma2 family endonuclease, partial [Candidatus Eremiobacteraeota bacterium]|nr:Uma2 family endonuclease [Candidatus Eremiobacteraeota bacterium]